METTCCELTNRGAHGLNATKARQTEELSNIQTTELSVARPAPLRKLSHAQCYYYHVIISIPETAVHTTGHHSFTTL